jgi:hypothetical protein
VTKALAEQVMFLWNLARASAFGLGILAALFAWPLFFLFMGVVYAATWGSDEPLKAACAQDTVFTRFGLVTDKRGFWQEHIAHLDKQIQHKEQLPAEIEADVAEAMRMLNDPEIQKNLREHAAQKTPAQRAADSLREQADSIEAGESKAAFRRQLQQEIADLQTCKARAAEQLAKVSG